MNIECLFSSRSYPLFSNWYDRRRMCIKCTLEYTYEKFRRGWDDENEYLGYVLDLA